MYVLVWPAGQMPVLCSVMSNSSVACGELSTFSVVSDRLSILYLTFGRLSNLSTVPDRLPKSSIFAAGCPTVCGSCLPFLMILTDCLTSVLL